MGKRLYHYTKLENLTSIFKHGLEPRSIVPLTVKEGVLYQKRDLEGNPVGLPEVKHGHTNAVWLTRNPNDFRLGDVRIAFDFEVEDASQVSRAMSPLVKWRSLIKRHGLPEEVYRQVGADARHWFLFDGVLGVSSYLVCNAMGKALGASSAMVVNEKGVVPMVPNVYSEEVGKALLPFGGKSDFISMAQLAANLGGISALEDGLVLENKGQVVGEFGESKVDTPSVGEVSIS